MIGDRYELEQQIGQGGTAAVWAGRDTVLGRRVALKRLGYSPGATESDALRAEREAHLTARVHHPNVVAVYDLVDDDDHTWLVMEHVDGPTLATLCDGEPLPPARAAHLLAQVADGLAAAHALGIVHRDVKPSNVLVADDDVAKLGDFGIARREHDEALTRTGLITGSPAYLAPEVARGQTATTASDVWALGATIYHVSTGRPPFAVGDDIIAAVQSIIDDTAPTLAVSHPLAPVVADAMHRDPAERPTMDEVAARLREHAPALAELVPSTAIFQEPDAPPVDEPVVSSDAEPTRSFSLASSSAPDAASALPPARGAGATRAGSRTAPDRRRLSLLVAAGVVSLLAAVGSAVLIERGDDAGSPPSSSTVADPPTAAVLEDFATDYLAAAGSDPRQGFSMLTPDYQAASGGLSGYEGFWGNVSDVKVERIAADADRLRVTYIYSYTYQGTPHTETVTLHLEQQGDRYLISGADSI